MAHQTEPHVPGAHPSSPHRAPLRLVVALVFLVAASATHAQRATRLVPSDGRFEDRFGSAVDVHLSRAVVGSPEAELDQVLNNPGVAYIFERRESDGRWTEVAKLIPPDATSYDGYGEGVAVWRSTVVIGSPSADEDDVEVGGGVYVYERIGPSEQPWELTAKLIAPNPAFGLKFGCELALEAEVLVVGTCTGNGGNEAVYIYERTSVAPSTWSEPQEIRVPEEALAFGRKLALSRGRLAAGIYFGDKAGESTGGVLVFERDTAERWVQTAELVAPGLSLYSNLGFGVDISSDTLVAGAPWNSRFLTNEGIAVVFERDPGTGEWRETARLEPPIGELFGYFGYAIGVDRDSIVVGAPDYDSLAPLAGLVYVYRRDANAPNGWRYVGRLEAVDPDAFEDFGTSLAFRKGTLIVGDPLDDVLSTKTGSITVFD